MTAPICFSGACYKRQFAAELAARLGCSPHFARRLLTVFAETVEAKLLAGGRVVLTGFGQFYCKRVGRKRMRVGQGARREIQVGGHRFPAFKPSDALRQRVREATRSNHPAEKGRLSDAGAGPGASAVRSFPKGPREAGHAR